jgi:hypothetical protein
MMLQSLVEGFLYAEDLKLKLQLHFFHVQYDVLPCTRAH